MTISPRPLGAAVVGLLREAGRVAGCSSARDAAAVPFAQVGTDVRLTCAQLEARRFCTDPTHGPRVRAACPVSCSVPCDQVDSTGQRDRMHVDDTTNTDEGSFGAVHIVLVVLLLVGLVMLAVLARKWVKGRAQSSLTLLVPDADAANTDWIELSTRGNHSSRALRQGSEKYALDHAEIEAYRDARQDVDKSGQSSANSQDTVRTLAAPAIDFDTLYMDKRHATSSSADFAVLKSARAGYTTTAQLNLFASNFDTFVSRCLEDCPVEQPKNFDDVALGADLPDSITAAFEPRALLTTFELGEIQSAVEGTAAESRLLNISSKFWDDCLYILVEQSNTLSNNALRTQGKSRSGAVSLGEFTHFVLLWLAEYVAEQGSRSADAPIEDTHLASHVRAIERAVNHVDDDNDGDLLATLDADAGDGAELIKCSEEFIVELHNQMVNPGSYDGEDTDNGDEGERIADLFEVLQSVLRGSAPPKAGVIASAPQVVAETLASKLHFVLQSNTSVPIDLLRMHYGRHLISMLATARDMCMQRPRRAIRKQSSFTQRWASDSFWYDLELRDETGTKVCQFGEFFKILVEETMQMPEQPLTVTVHGVCDAESVDTLATLQLNDSHRQMRESSETDNEREGEQQVITLPGASLEESTDTLSTLQLNASGGGDTINFTETENVLALQKRLSKRSKAPSPHDRPEPKHPPRVNPLTGKKSSRWGNAMGELAQLQRLAKQVRAYLLDAQNLAHNSEHGVPPADAADQLIPRHFSDVQQGNLVRIAALEDTMDFIYHESNFHEDSAQGVWTRFAWSSFWVRAKLDLDHTGDGRCYVRDFLQMLTRKLIEAHKSSSEARQESGLGRSKLSDPVRYVSDNGNEFPAEIQSQAPTTDPSTQKSATAVQARQLKLDAGADSTQSSDKEEVIYTDPLLDDSTISGRLSSTDGRVEYASVMSGSARTKDLQSTEGGSVEDDDRVIYADPLFEDSVVSGTSPSSYGRVEYASVTPSGSARGNSRMSPGGVSAGAYSLYDEPDASASHAPSVRC